MQLQRLKEIGEMKELEGEYVNAINELMHQHQETTKRHDVVWYELHDCLNQFNSFYMEAIVSIGSRCELYNWSAP